MGNDWRSLILMGGRGRRMGYVDKGQLIYRGRTFLNRIKDELLPLGLPCVISTADRENLTGEDGTIYVKDIPKLPDGSGAGPMGGIWSCFQKTGAEGFFTVSCDMPLFRREMFLALMDRVRPEYDAVLWRTRDGRIQPMCGYYSRACLFSLTKSIRERNYQMTRFLSQLNCLVVDTSLEHIPDYWFTNVNSPDALETLNGRKLPVLAVSGRKNTGKTTLLEQLVRSLCAAGIRVAVIKHDGHEFEADVPGTDSRRMKDAGAYGTVVYSGTKFSMVKEKGGLKAEDFFGCFSEADIILLEGQKDSDYLKLETVRQEISTVPVCRSNTVLAYVSDGKVEQRAAAADKEAGTETYGPAAVMTSPKPVYHFQDTDQLTELIVGVLDGHF